MIKHLHHKIPRHAGGTDDPSNLVSVTVEEHAELHLDLFLQYGRWQDWVACQMLSGIVGKEEGVAQVCRHAAQKPRSEEFKKKIAAANRRRGPMSEETKRKISEAKKGKPSWNKGKKSTEQHRQRLSETRKRLFKEGKLTAPMQGRKAAAERGPDGRFINNNKTS